MSAGRSVKDVILMVIFGAVFIGFLAFAAVRTADLYYKAGWMVAHFPPKGRVCNELFCLRTDTSKPEWKFLEWHFFYCPQHLSGGFQGRGGRSGGIIIYMSLFMTVFSFASVPVVGALFRILAWPVLIPLRLAGKLPPGHLLPFAHFGAGVDRAPGDWLELAGMWTGGVMAVVAIAFYCIW